MKFILKLFFTLVVAGVDAYTYKKVNIRDVSALTFSKGLYTTGQRYQPISQLSCRGENCWRFQPEVIQCSVSGWNGDDAQWKCEATLPFGIDLGRTDVVCEGFDFPGDVYILEGSCGLEYTLTDIKTNSVNYDDDHSFIGIVIFVSSLIIAIVITLLSFTLFVPGFVFGYNRQSNVYWRRNVYREPTYYESNVYHEPTYCGRRNVNRYSSSRPTNNTKTSKGYGTTKIR